MAPEIFIPGAQGTKNRRRKPVPVSGTCVMGLKEHFYYQPFCPPASGFISSKNGQNFQVGNSQDNSQIKTLVMVRLIKFRFDFNSI